VDFAARFFSLTHYTVQAGLNNPRSWLVSGSHNSVDWHPFHNVSDSNDLCAANSTRTYAAPSGGPFRYFRFESTAPRCVDVWVNADIRFIEFFWSLSGKLFFVCPTLNRCRLFPPRLIVFLFSFAL
jgi:hypothetical protein